LKPTTGDSKAYSRGFLAFTTTGTLVVAAAAAVVVAVVVLLSLSSSPTSRAPEEATAASKSAIELAAAAASEATAASSLPLEAYAWQAPQMSLQTAFEKAFSDQHPWQEVTFEEDPSEAPMTQQRLFDWIEKELFGGADPFAEWSGKVPLPKGPPNAEDRVPPGQWVSYSRRQTCFIAAKSLVGAKTAGYANGLERYLSTEAPAVGCTPRTGDFGRSLFFLLATCAADPTMANGAQGPFLIVAKAVDSPPVEAVKAAAQDTQMADAGIRVCQYNDGAPTMEGVPTVPAEGCTQPTATAVGKDFMTGGLEGQALQDISASWFGGYIWSYGCGLGGGQDERLMTYMPEIFVFAFFLSEAPGTNPQERHTPQLRQPAWILGARVVMAGLDGTAAHNDPPKLDPKVSMSSGLVDVSIGGKSAKISDARPFVAFMSENQDYELSNGCPGVAPNNDAVCDRACRTRLARINRLLAQRAVDPGCSFNFGNQVRAWYRSTALTSYHGDVQVVLKKVVKSLGSGPWGSGLWWGDSQLMTLAMWIGHSISAKTWGGAEAFPLDYYMYSAFTENPGNQCYNHGKEGCQSCLKQCGTPPPSAYWLPGFAYTGVPANYEDWGAPPQSMGAKACVTEASSCGEKGFADILAQFGSSSAAQLWDKVEGALRARSGATSAEGNVFDALSL